MDAKKTLKKHGIRPNKKMGQNFLINQEIAERQVEYADIQPGEKILEIGGGLGILTEKLLEKNGEVIVIEKDPDLHKILKEKYGDKITLIKGDALEIDFGETDKIVANLPYQISSEITFKLLKQNYKKAILMYQKEFAERMTAKPGTKKYGRLTVGVNHYAESKILETINKNAFYPKPKINSALVELIPKKPKYNTLNQNFFFKFTKAVFSQRRKKLKNAIKNTKHMLKPKPTEKTIQKTITKIEEYKNKRPEKLTPKQLAFCSNQLYREIKNKQKK